MRVVSAIRVLINSVRDALIQRADFLGRSGESFTDRELFGHYGFASHPLSGAEGVTVFINGDVNNAVVVATEDRRYRLALSEGEVGLYSDEGDFIHLRRGREIYVNSGSKVTVEAPDVLVKGNVTVEGDLHVTGEVSDGVRAMSADRAIYNMHTHPPGNNPPEPQE